MRGGQKLLCFVRVAEAGRSKSGEDRALSVRFVALCQEHEPQSWLSVDGVQRHRLGTLCAIVPDGTGGVVLDGTWWFSAEAMRGLRCEACEKEKG